MSSSSYNKRRKFYQQEEFTKLQDKWYTKLEKSGFKDLEAIYKHKERKFIGNEVFYLKYSRNHTPEELRKSLSLRPELLNFFRNCRNFLRHAPFYTNLLDNFNKKHQNPTIYASLTAFELIIPSSTDKTLITQLPKLKFKEFSKFLKTIPFYYDKHDEILWRLYIEGHTIRFISSQLQSLWKSTQISIPNTDTKNMRYREKTRKPYSVFWVKHRINDLQLDMIEFNATMKAGIESSKTAETSALSDYLDILESSPIDKDDKGGSI